MFILRWKQPSLDANKAAEINVPVGAVVSNKAPIRFTGKGAANYGGIQQENLMRLTENFADAVPPPFPTVGVIWFDTVAKIAKVCTSVAPVTWKPMGGLESTGVGANPPASPNMGDMWFQLIGGSTGIMYVYTGLGRYPEGNGTIGGWNQVWPQIDTIGGREEYDFVADMVDQLIDSTKGGTGEKGTTITDLTQFANLDADKYAKWQAAGSDVNALFPAGAPADEFTIDPNSNDWDKLLAAARYAVNRLDMPATVVGDISTLPFVTDGRQAPASLTSLPTDDVRYPTLQRRSNRRFGAATLLRSFTETLNVLSDRYSLKGMSGISGANHSFNGNVTTTQHAAFTGLVGGGSSATLSLRFNWPGGDNSAFLRGGGAIQLTLTHVPVGTVLAGDTNMKALLDQRGVLRITADQIRIFSQTLPRSFAVDPVKSGFLTAGTGVAFSTTQTVNGATYVVTGTNFGTHLLLTATCTSTGPMNGRITFSYAVIRDTSTYMNGPTSTELYPGPITFTAPDKTAGSAFLI